MQQMSITTNTLSRRSIFNLIGGALGSAAVLQTSAALGLMPLTTAVNLPQLPMLPSGQGRTVAILGGGISGLTAMYELEKAGYDCVLLEASHRVGGRNFTVRAGSVIDEIGNQQICDFDDEPHLYFNAGPARIPATHRYLMHYCKELGVELELFINENKESWYQDDAFNGGKPVRNAVFTTSVRGLVAELMAKSFTRAELDLPLSEAEAERVLAVIRSWGDLDSELNFKGSGRAGYASGGFLEKGVYRELLSLQEVLKTRYVSSALNANEGETGPMLFQPVGGMDRIVTGFAARLRGPVHTNAAVTSIEVQESGVGIIYEQQGVKQALRADFCINCIPSHLLTGITNNFPGEYRQALSYIRRGEAYKSAHQAKRRFWEDEDIYGGISWTNHPIQQIWYPSHGFHKQKGIILSAYNYGGGMHFTQMSQQERMEVALAQGEKIHPGYAGHLEKGVSIAWHRMNHMLGCSARFGRSSGGLTQAEQAMMKTLQSSVAGRHYLVGDQVTLHAGWQEAAILSAHAAIKDISRQVNPTKEVSRV
jgi:monoamine oxidase